MIENRTIQLAEIPIGGKGGAVWNHLHGEREDVCEALLKASTHQRQQLLQARLRSIDDALDRLMSGSYGICSKCGRRVEDATLDVDAARALCLDCENRDLKIDRSFGQRGQAPFLTCASSTLPQKSRIALG